MIVLSFNPQTVKLLSHFFNTYMFTIKRTQKKIYTCVQYDQKRFSSSHCVHIKISLDCLMGKLGKDANLNLNL